MSCLHRPSCGRQQSEYAARQQNIKPIIEEGSQIPLPEAAGSPKDIFRRHITQHPDMEISQLPRRSRLRSRISKPPYRMIGNSNHHAAPKQIRENIPKGAVKYT